MKPESAPLALEPPDAHCLNAAIGWLELGNPAEALAELAQLSPAASGLPDVLEVRWQVCAELKRWEEGLQTARRLLAAAPERPSGWLHHAYALRRVPGGSLSQAWDALLPAAKMFPKEAIIAYNLSCYACQMQQLDLARDWFRRAVAVGVKATLQTMALEDPDLEPLRDEIRRL